MTRCPLPYSLLLASCDPFALKRIDITTDVNHEGSARRTRPGYWRPGRGRRPNRRRRGVRASTTWPTATVTSATEEGRWWRAGFPINTNQGQDVNWKICTGFPTVLLFIFSGVKALRALGQGHCRLESQSCKFPHVRQNLISIPKTPTTKTQGKTARDRPDTRLLCKNT